MSDIADVAVVGAGPAGLTAAVTAGRAGARVLLVHTDVLPSPAGPWTAPEGGPWRRVRSCGRIEVLAGAVRQVATSPYGVELLVAPDDGGPVRTCGALAVVLATGSADSLPSLTGRGLEGVWTAGRALTAPTAASFDGRVVLAGGGPFVLPAAADLLRRGVPLAEVFDATGSAVTLTSLPMAGWRARVAEARRLLWENDVPYHPGWAPREIRDRDGSGRTAALVLAREGRGPRTDRSTLRTVFADQVVITTRRVPRVDMAQQLGVEIVGRGTDRYVRCDAYGRTGVPEVVVAGDLTGSWGRASAAAQGELAGTAALVAVFGRGAATPSAHRLRRLVRHDRRARAAAPIVVRRYRSGPALRPMGADLTSPWILEPAVHGPTLGALALLELPDRHEAMVAREANLSEHARLSAGLPPLHDEIFGALRA